MTFDLSVLPKAKASTSPIKTPSCGKMSRFLRSRSIKAARSSFSRFFSSCFASSFCASSLLRREKRGCSGGFGGKSKKCGCFASASYITHDFSAAKPPKANSAISYSVNEGRFSSCKSSHASLKEAFSAARSVSFSAGISRAVSEERPPS